MKPQGNKIRSLAALPWADQAAAPALVLEYPQVHVWKACLDVPAPVLAGLISGLAPDEHERAGKFQRERSRDRFLAGRGLLRHILGSYLDQAPRRIRFTYTASGKPLLGPAPDGRALHFSVSHSGGWALFAISRQEPVGIDLEQIRPDFPIAPLASRFFTPDECEDILATPESGRASRFYQHWVRREACAKALGQDVWALLRRSGPLQEEAVHIRDLALHPRYAAALAIKGQRFSS